MKKSIYISVPAVNHGANAITNEEIFERIKKNFRGSPLEFSRIKTGIRTIFRQCDSEIRYFGTAKGKKPVDYAAKAVKDCLKECRTDKKRIGALLYGGIYREYFEPAVAMEIAANCGFKELMAFDTTSACAGFLQATYNGSALMQMEDELNVVVCSTMDFPDVKIDFDIQSFSDLTKKAAGLTVGSGSAAWLLSTKPFPNGSFLVNSFLNFSVPESFDVCQTPVFDYFYSDNKVLFDLGKKHIPEQIKRIVKKSGWKMNEVAHFISHQPGEKIINEIYKVLKVSSEKTPIIHNLYGNTVNATIPMTLRHIYDQGKLKNGDKLVFTTTAAGFTVVAFTAEWISPE